MGERFLRLRECAEMMGTSPNMARSLLSAHNVWPIDLGYGRSRGARWLESAVVAAMRQIHADAQPKRKKAASGRPRAAAEDMADMSIDDLHLLTHSQRVS